MGLLSRDLGIGGEAHKKIDAAVKQGGFEIVNKPFDLGISLFHCWHVLPRKCMASRGLQHVGPCVCYILGLYMHSKAWQV